MRKIHYKRPPLVDYQTRIIDSPARFTVTEASTKTGKTTSHIVWLAEQPLVLNLKSGQKVWWVAPVYGQAEIAFNRMRNQISNKDFYKANESKLKLTLPFGAEIWFKSASDPDNLYGDDVYAAVFDEFTRAKEEAWFALRSTLTATQAKCKFIGNVRGKGNWGYRLALRAKDPANPEYEHFKITAYDAVDAGILALEEVEQAKKDLPDYVFKELYLAEASDDGSNPFGIKHIERQIKPLSKKIPVCYGIDIAKSVDFTVIIGLDEDGVVCYFDRFQKDWLQTKNEIARVVAYTPCLIDSTGNGDNLTEDVQRITQNTEGFKFSSPSKQQLMERLAMGIQSSDVYFPEGIITDELYAFEFEYTRTGVKYSAPTGIHDDCVCALALAYKKFKELKTYATIALT